MRGVIINRSGNAPAEGDDGAIHLYASLEVGDKTWFNTRKRVIFVNGMNTSPEKFRKGALALSTLLGCPVTGVYNKTDGLFLDVGQCITDKMKFDVSVTTQRIVTFDDWKALVDIGHRVVKKIAPNLTRVAYVRSLIDRNPATASLYDLLQAPGYFQRGVPIFAHSQGNLITSNALTALALAEGLKAIEGRLVHSYGSPCRFWPTGIVHQNNVFTFDPIGYLDLRMSWNFSKVGFSVSHDFLIYMQHDPEFVINRFRLGGWGMTFSMDEEGLGNALADMGANVDRLHRIFERLKSAHNADADDVAVHYIRKLRKTGREKVLRAMAKAKPELVQLLITILDEGYTTDEERSFIDLLRSMLK